MHEVSIAEEIKDIVREKLKEHKAKKVTKIGLIIGEMTSIVPDALTFAFESVGRGTPMEHAEINMEHVKLKAKCTNCSKQFKVKDFEYVCSFCGSTRVKVTQGKEMIIKTIEME